MCCEGILITETMQAHNSSLLIMSFALYSLMLPAAWQLFDSLTGGSLWGGTRYPATDLLLRFRKFIRKIRKEFSLLSILFSEVRNARQFINMMSGAHTCNQAYRPGDGVDVLSGVNFWVKT